MIDEINFKNYKSIKEIDIELKNLNVLIGANGAGKSNFISFFEFLNNIYNQNLQNYVNEQDGCDNILYFGTKESAQLYCKVTFDNTNFYEFILKPILSNGLYFEYETNGFNIYHDYQNKTPYWNIETGIKGNKESTYKSNSSKRIGYIKEYLNSFRVFHFHDTGRTAAVKKYSNINDNSYLREDGQNLASFLFLLSKKYPASFKLIEKIVKSVAPFFKSFDLKPMALNNELIKLEWKEEGTDKYFDANNLSDGTLRFICIATLLLQPKLPKTIIIDEPELGLHPFAINKLAGLINSASNSTQIIISTQSVNLIENFQPDDIIVVDRKDKQSVFNRLSSNELKGWLDDYSLGELWDKNIIGGRP